MSEKYSQDYQTCYGSIVLINILFPWFLLTTFAKTVEEWNLFLYGESSKNHENTDNFNLLAAFFILIEANNIFEYNPTLIKSTIHIVTGLKKYFFFKIEM